MESLKDDEELLRGSTQLGLRLYQVTCSLKRKRLEDLLFSPFAMSVALASVLWAAKGATEKQLHEYFSDLDATKVVASLARCLKETLVDSGKYACLMANGWFAQTGVEFESDFEDAVTRDLKMTLSHMDFADELTTALQLNSWIASKSNQKMDKLLDSDPLLEEFELKLMSLGAVAIEGTLAAVSDREVQEGFFPLSTPDKGTKIPMLEKKGYYYYHSRPNLEMLGIPFASSDVVMYIFLPSKRDGLIDFEATLDYSELVKLISAATLEMVTATIPQICMIKELDLQQLLMSIGLTEVFQGGKANLSNLSKTSGLNVGAMIQQVFFQPKSAVVDSAQEHAAGQSTADRNFNFKADHPFFFLVQHETTKQILLVGRMAQVPTTYPMTTADLTVPAYHTVSLSAKNETYFDGNFSLTLAVFKYLLQKQLNIKNATIEANENLTVSPVALAILIDGLIRYLEKINPEQKPSTNQSDKLIVKLQKSAVIQQIVLDVCSLLEKLDKLATSCDFQMGYGFFFDENRNPNSADRAISSTEPKDNLDPADNLTESFQNGTVSSAEFSSNPKRAIALINDWINADSLGNVEGKIHGNFIKQDVDWVIANMAYMSLAWNLPVESKEIQQFYPISQPAGVPVRMIRISYPFYHYEDATVEVLGVPCEIKEIWTYMIIPKDNDNFPKWLESITSNDFAKWVNAGEQTSVHAIIPQFALVQRMKEPILVDKALQRLHVQDVQKNAKTTRVFQMTSVEVVVGKSAFLERSVKPTVKTFVANRPFIMLMQHILTSLILFLGNITEVPSSAIKQANVTAVEKTIATMQLSDNRKSTTKATPEDRAEAESKVLTANTDFATDILKSRKWYTVSECFPCVPSRLVNLLVSPIGLAIMLHTALLGSEGQTWRYILKKLVAADLDVHNPALPLSADTVESKLTKFFEWILNEILAGDTPYEATLVNGAYVERTLGANDDYSLPEQFDTDLEGMDMKNNPVPVCLDLNRRTRIASDDVFKAFIPPNVVKSSTCLLLLNGLYIKMDWIFKEAQNYGTKLSRSRFQPFSGASQSVRVAHAVEKVLYYDDGTTQLVGVTSDQNALTLFVILPGQTKDAFVAFDEQLNAKTLNSLMAKAEKRLVEVIIPEFQLLTPAKFNVKSAFKSCGMAKVVGSYGRFSRMANTSLGQKWRTSMVHRCCFKFQPKCAGTNVKTEGDVSLGPNVPKFVVNRPFFFVLRHETTKVLLLLGRIEVFPAAADSE